MGLRAWNVAVLMSALALLVAGGTQRERPLVPRKAAGDLLRIEQSTAAAPENAEALRTLAQAYVDAELPGLAVRAVEGAGPKVRRNLRVSHAYARALLDEGRAADALAEERRVLSACAEALGDGVVGASVEPDAVSGRGACDGWLVASATRRIAIMSTLVDMGIDDPSSHPESAAVAYLSATREARLAIR